MINSVRNTVLAVANKQNFGYISPADFNLYAKQAQLDIFEDYFYRYNEWMVKQNSRVSGSGYADIVKNLEEVIDLFSVQDSLYRVNPPSGISMIGNLYNMPNETNNDNTYYLLNKVLVYKNILTEGTTTGVTVGNNGVVDTSKDFVSLGVSVGDYVAIQVGDRIFFERINSITGTDTLVVSNTNISSSSSVYSVYEANTIQKEVERVSHSKITMLNSSNLTAPKLNTPAYTQSELTISVFPNSVDAVGQVTAQYIRKPRDPKWTYTSLSGGEPAFDQSSTDYQDFELPITDEPNLVNKILKYAGISIREADVYQTASNEEIKEAQKQG